MKYDNVEVADGNPAASHIDELVALRDDLHRIASHLGSIPPVPVLGVIGGGQAGVTGALDTLRQAVAVTELRRRLDGFEVRSYNLIESPLPSTVTGETLWPLGAATTTPADQLSSCLALLSAVEETPTELEKALADAPNVIKLLTQTAEAEIATVDPIMMLRRVLGPEALGARLRYLQMAAPGTPHSKYLLYHLRDRLQGDSTGAGLDLLARRFELELTRTPDDIGPLDLAALVAGASLVLSDEGSFVKLSSGLGIPALSVPTDEAELSTWVLNAALPTAGIEEFEPAGDAAFDELGAKLTELSSRWLADTAPERIQDLAHRVEILETVNSGLRSLLHKERRVLADLLASAEAVDAVAQISARRPASASTRKQLQLYEERIEHLEEEIRRIYGTRLMRSIKPLRHLYSRVRSSR